VPSSSRSGVGASDSSNFHRRYRFFKLPPASASQAGTGAFIAEAAAGVIAFSFIRRRASAFSIFRLYPQRL